ncbi:MAG: AMP-binding protein [Chloroflexi bacterium]|nr:AMP-binding protein [Chloroflexota bacterium]
MRLVDGFVQPKAEDTEKYLRMGWWRNITLGDVLDKAAALHPDKEALVDDRCRLNYSQLKESVDRLAIGLSGLGLGDGDCVMVQLPNWGEYVLTLYALAKIGAPAVLLLPRHMQLEINHFCALTRAKAWIVPETYRKTDYRPVIEDVKKANPSLEHIITVRGGKNTPFVNFEGMIADTDLSSHELQALKERKPDARQIAFILPTGGTTGLPKAVPRTHNNAVCEAEYKAISRKQSADDVCLLCVPLEHNLGLASLDSTVFSYGKLVLLDSTLPEDFCAAVQRERVTRAPIVPTLLDRFVSFEELDKYDLGSLRALYVGGAKTPPDVIQATHKKLGRVYVTAFGMSEGVTCTTRLDDDEDTILNTVGRPCCPHDELIVVDADGRKLPSDREGELLAKGPGVFSGYLGAPEENRLAFTSDGYFLTGDLAMISDSGVIRITGRSKDIIIRGGENISPVEIESLLRQHPDVEDVAVIGMPDKELGERACAYIKPRENANPSLESLVRFIRSKGASVLQLPERIELIYEIPLTNIGKPDKKALRDDLKRRLAASNDDKK